MSYEETKYAVGDAFVRNYDGVNWLCILMSRDFEKSSNRMVWQSTMLMLFDDGSLGGGSTTGYYEEDLDGLISLGAIFKALYGAAANRQRITDFPVKNDAP